MVKDAPVPEDGRIEDAQAGREVSVVVGDGDAQQRQERHTGGRRPSSPVACPICRTLDVIHEEADQLGTEWVRDTYRCTNDHRWTAPRRGEDDQRPNWYLMYGMIHPHGGAASIHCPKCQREAVYRGYSRGVCTCGSCGFSNEYVLRWPEDAYYACEVDGHILWAWTRGHAAALKDFIASDGRDPTDYPGYEGFLRHIPKEFLFAKHRDTALRRLSRLLGI